MQTLLVNSLLVTRLTSNEPTSNESPIIIPS